MSLKRRSLRIGSRRRQYKRLPRPRVPYRAGSGADLDRWRQRSNLLTDYSSIGARRRKRRTRSGSSWFRCRSARIAPGNRPIERRLT